MGGKKRAIEEVEYLSPKNKGKDRGGRREQRCLLQERSEKKRERGRERGIGEKTWRKKPEKKSGRWRNRGRG